MQSSWTLGEALCTHPCECILTAEVVATVQQVADGVRWLSGYSKREERKVRATGSINMTWLDKRQQAKLTAIMWHVNVAKFV